MISLLFLGDICGPVGRQVVRNHLKGLVEKYQIDFVIANAENATHGRGLSLSHYLELSSCGVGCMTMGNHFFAVEEILRKTDKYENMIRPANFAGDCPGRGTSLFQIKNITLRVTNLLGFSEIAGAQSNPFRKLEEIISQEELADIHIVDFHAEATGEKAALARAFDGRVSAVIGTHTHVQTADARALPKGTGFLSDVGACCAHESILGMEPEPIIFRNSTGMPSRFRVPREGRGQLNACLLVFGERHKLLEIKTIAIVE